jgi:hypothetical protein
MADHQPRSEQRGNAQIGRDGRLFLLVMGATIAAWMIAYWLAVK